MAISQLTQIKNLLHPTRQRDETIHSPEVVGKKACPRSYDPRSHSPQAHTSAARNPTQQLHPQYASDGLRVSPPCPGHWILELREWRWRREAIDQRRVACDTGEGSGAEEMLDCEREGGSGECRLPLGAAVGVTLNSVSMSECGKERRT